MIYIGLKRYTELLKILWDKNAVKYIKKGVYIDTLHLLALYFELYLC